MMGRLAAHLKKFGGCALVVDYGHMTTSRGETVQAVKGHRFVSPFADPGEADITAHVDFEALAAAARQAFQQGLEIAQRLAQADPTSAQAQRDLSVSFERLGNVQLQSGQVTEALRSYEKGLEISQKLAAADPSDAQAKRHLALFGPRADNSSR